MPIPIPPPPAMAPPPISKSTLSSQQQSLQDELETLRRRGLARFFNKHFTSSSFREQSLTTKERRDHMADVALRVMERRKSELKQKKSLSSSSPPPPPPSPPPPAAAFEDGGEGGGGDSKAMSAEKKDVVAREKEGDEGGGNESRVVRQADLLRAKMRERTGADCSPDVHPKRRTRDLETSATSRLGDFTPSTPSQTYWTAALAKPSDDTQPNAQNSPSIPTLSQQQQQQPLPTPESTSTSSKPLLIAASLLASPSSDQDDDDDDDEALQLSDLTPDTENQSEATLAPTTRTTQPQKPLAAFLRKENDALRRIMQSIEDTNQMHLSSTNTADHSDDASGLASEEERAAAEEAASQAEQLARTMAESSKWMTQDPFAQPDKQSEHQHTGHTNGFKTDHGRWKVYFSEMHQRDYYYDSETDTTTWTKPAALTIQLHQTTNDQDRAVEIGDHTQETRQKHQNGNDTASNTNNKNMERNLIDIGQFRPDSAVGDSPHKPSGDRGVASAVSSPKNRAKEYHIKRRKAQYKRRLRMAMTVGALGAAGAGYLIYPTQVNGILGRVLNTNATHAPHLDETTRLQDEEGTLSKDRMNKFEKVMSGAVAKSEIERKAAYEAKKQKKAEELRSKRYKEEQEERKRQEEQQILQAAKLQLQEEQLRNKRQEEEKAKWLTKKAEEEELLQDQKRVEREEAARRLEADREAREQRQRENEAAAAKKQLEMEQKALQQTKQRKLEDAAKQKKIKEKMEQRIEHKEKEKVDVLKRSKEEKRTLEVEMDNPSSTPEFQMIDVAKKGSEQSDVVAIITTKAPRGCAVPFAHIFSGACRKAPPPFDVKTLTDAMLQ